jgi:hypothetical protein
LSEVAWLAWAGKPNKTSIKLPSYSFVNNFDFKGQMELSL